MIIRQTHNGKTVPIRLCLNNESGYYLDICMYRETTDPRTGVVKFEAYGPRHGPRHVLDFTIDGIVNWIDRQRSSLAFGHVRQPTQNALDAFQVVCVRTVGYTVVVHNLNAAELRVRCVDFSSQQSVKSTVPCQNYMRIFDLNNTLTQADQISSNANSSTRHQRNSHNILDKQNKQTK